ncbi:MAG: ATP-dependent DNA helicase RecQ [Verrucomicrobia bacterium]|nr:ATP-dependent DNA helicase RecQ [Verrucomicrobiota bacterium]
MAKILHRGELAYCSTLEEEWILKWYGEHYGIRDKEEKGSITYQYSPELKKAFSAFRDLLEPWNGEIQSIQLDPEHPENERRLVSQLLEEFGIRLPHTLTPQVELENILADQDRRAFQGQRGDLLFTAPNGRSLLLEPGIHEAPAQQHLDSLRDNAFAKVGIPTMRPHNDEIGSLALSNSVKSQLNEIGFLSYLDPPKLPDDQRLACNYLFLLPSLLVRVQWVLIDLLFLQGYARQPTLTIGLVERDLECIELAVMGLYDRIYRLANLYQIDIKLPQLVILAQRNRDYHHPQHRTLDVNITDVKNIQQEQCDFVLDVAIKCNALTKPLEHHTSPVISIRQSYPHNRRFRFAYRARPRPIKITDQTLIILESFLQDFFRKRSFRPGQYEIISHILMQKQTIGLLPTSAGKSVCYQLSALLTPGTTFVIDPVIALMDDQTQTLREFHGIDRVLALHSNAGIRPQDVPRLLAENLMVFISPERLQRPNFRAALNANHAADLFINYAVIDEAHCVSMWGHDFRPSYLTMRENLMRLCTFQGMAPVLVALTGTASQLVLIDLKRELDILEMEAVIQPKTFDRKELRFHLCRCPKDDKVTMLENMMSAISSPTRLNVQDLSKEAWGIVFGYYPNQLWTLLGIHVADANELVHVTLEGADPALVRHGIYTGSKPNGCPLDDTEWKNYKSRVLTAFKRGDIHMLFGNTAVSVGIDNERLNYVINYQMPQCMEAYYQQCGRAGRSGQQSECVLIFSDDDPIGTQNWLNGGNRAHNWDDIRAAVFFHGKNFPGEDIDLNGAMAVFSVICNVLPEGVCEIPMYLVAERTERYLTFWLMLGVVSYYEVSGGGEENTFYHAYLHPTVRSFLNAPESRREPLREPLNQHLIDSLHKYLTRYRPIPRSKIQQEVNEIPQASFSGKCAAYLIKFIYSQIAYQRKEGIRTMVTFCNEEDVSPELIRNRIRAYFDSSEKFSKGLMAMANQQAAFSTVQTLIDRIESFNDAETLYWETRRLLDERYRIDWAAAGLFAIAYREKGRASTLFKNIFDGFLNEITDEIPDENGQTEFLLYFLISLYRLDRVFDEQIAEVLVFELIEIIFRKYRQKSFKIIVNLSEDFDVRVKSKIHIFNLQLQEMIDAKYSRIIG